MKVNVTTGGNEVLYSLSDLARALGVAPQYMHRRAYVMGTLDPPTHVSGQRKYYTAAEFARLVVGEQQRKTLKARA